MRQRVVRSCGSGRTDRTIWVVRSDEDGDGRTKMGTAGRRWGRTLTEWDCGFRVAVNETAIEIGKPQEGHYISDLPGFGPVLDGLDFVLGH